MVTRTDVEHMASTIATASDQAKQQVGALMTRLAGQPATVVRDALADAFPTLLAGFENVGTVAGLEFYDSMRARTRGLPAYKATAVANPTPTAEAVGIARAAARHLFNTDIAPEVAGERTRRELSDVLGTRTKNAMRQTIKNNAVRDPAKTSFARVPRGAKTCAFCTMLASRGFVYATAKTAGEDDKYHHDCDCMIVPSWDAKQAKLEGYNPDKYWDQYLTARRALEAAGAEKIDAPAVTAKMRELFPGEFTDSWTGRLKGRPKTKDSEPRKQKPKGTPKITPKPKPKTQKKTNATGKATKPPAPWQPNTKALFGNAPSIEEAVLNEFRDSKVKYLPVHGHSRQPQESEIIFRISGGDMTKGSCASLALAFAANSAGLNVCDYRGEPSRRMFADGIRIRKILTSTGVESYSERHFNDLKAVGKLLDRTETGKKYILVTGRHAAVIRNTGSRYEYLELQSPYPDQNSWHELTKTELRKRFHCKMSHSIRGFKYEADSTIAEISTLARSDGYAELMGYLNTTGTKQQKGSLGAIK